MNHKTHIGFVHAHAKGIRGNHHLEFAAHEGILHRVAFLGFSSAVIMTAFDPKGCHKSAQFFGFFTGTDINQTWAR